MAVEDWIADFYVLHRQRHPGAFLPSEDTEEGIDLVKALRSNFVHRGVHDFEVADAASQLLLCEEIARPRDHLPALIRIAVGIYRQRVEARGGSTLGQGGSLVEAERASAGCVYCGGDGFASLRLREPLARYARGGGTPYRHTAVTPCVCLAGRWYRACWESGPVERQVRSVSLEDVIAGRTRYVAIGDEGEK